MESPAPDDAGPPSTPMNTVHPGDELPVAGPHWATSSFGDGCDTKPTELTALGAHVAECRATSSRFGSLQAIGHALHRLTAPRLITTLVLVLALLGAAYLVL